MRGREVCYHHGGKSLMGIASPTYRTGRYSSVIPTHLADLYQADQAAGDSMGIKEDLDLHTTLLRGALQAMSRGEAGELWVKLKEEWSSYNKAKKDTTGKLDPSENLSMVGFLISEGYQDYMARIELRQMLQERAKLVDVEGKRLERAQNSIRKSELMVAIDKLMEIIQRNVTDRRLAGTIIGEFVALVRGGFPR